MVDNFDFSGYATKNGLKCSDGRTIIKDAFKGNNGIKVPLVWQHLHNEPGNILGHAMLENREDGVYAYIKTNESASGKNAKLLVQSGDITSLSIYANELVQQGKNVIHGVIREVSLVLSGANPGATIDNIAIAHGDGSSTSIEDEAVIYTDATLELPEVKHAATTTTAAPQEETVGDIFDTLTPKQKDVVYALIAQVVDGSPAAGTATHSNEDEGEVMKNNVFDADKQNVKGKNSLTHAQFMEIQTDAVKNGSFKDSFLAHAVTYGIENIDYLFPDATALNNTPTFVQRRMEWVSRVLTGTNHTPFSRIKTLTADITLDTARAKGYVKGTLKKEEFFALSKRSTTPTTIYKKQKLDRDDIIDITDLDVVAWLKQEMRLMLDEEIARAILVGDGREADAEDKIQAGAGNVGIRPIWTDDDFYSHKVQLEHDSTIKDAIKAIIVARKNYKGSGNPVLFTTTDFLTDMLLLEDGQQRRIYTTQQALEADLRVSGIVEVEIMDGLTRDTGALTTLKHWSLLGILVNLKDYSVGADKGGAVAMFDDFDIDFNQQKYLIETRCSGALTLPKSAIVIEKEDTSG